MNSCHHEKVYTGASFVNVCSWYYWICEKCGEVGHDILSHDPHFDQKKVDKLFTKDSKKSYFRFIRENERIMK